MSQGNWQQHGGAALRVRSGSLSPHHGGSSGPCGHSCGPSPPGGAALAEARIQLAEPQPEFPGQGNRLVSGAEVQSEADPGRDSHARSPLPTAHRRLFSTCLGPNKIPAS